MTTKKAEITYTGKATSEQIEAWKKEHGEVKEIEVVVDATNVSVGYVRKANRLHIARAMSLVVEKMPVEAGESILEATWLGGDPRIISVEDKDSDFRVGAAWVIYETTKIYAANIKNV